YLSWLEATGGEGHDLRFARLDGDGWTAPTTIRSSDRFFVNWADFPSLTATSDGTLWAHWLERGEAGGRDYGIRVGRSADGGVDDGSRVGRSGAGGVACAAPRKPHEGETPTRPGFGSMLPIGGGIGLAWLDGRRYVEGPDGAAATQEMTLRFRAVNAAGEPGP